MQLDVMPGTLNHTQLDSESPQTQDSSAGSKVRSGSGWSPHYSTAPRGCGFGPHAWVPAGTSTVQPLDKPEQDGLQGPVYDLWDLPLPSTVPPPPTSLHLYSPVTPSEFESRSSKMKTTAEKQKENEKNAVEWPFSHRHGASGDVKEPLSLLVTALSRF